MGGPGSGGYKSLPGDVETHSAWDIIPPDPKGTQKLAQVRCKYCSREMAQHTSRQRVHLLGCHAYLDEMKAQGIENSITRQAADPAAFFRNSKSLQGHGEPKAPKVLRMHEHSTAVRIQALALAEASISSERIHEITGVDPKQLAGLRKLARERGYDPHISMQLKEEYVLDPPNTNRPRGRPKKRKQAPGAEGEGERGAEGEEEEGVDPALTAMQNSRAPPGYVQADSLPPGNWNFIAPSPQGFGFTA